MKEKGEDWCIKVATLPQPKGRFTIYAWASITTESAYKMIWTRVATCAYTGIEIISIPAYVTRVQIILYALLVVTQRRQITQRSLKRILWTGLYASYIDKDLQVHMQLTQHL